MAFGRAAMVVCLLGCGAGPSDKSDPSGSGSEGADGEQDGAPIPPPDTATDTGDDGLTCPQPMECISLAEAVDRDLVQIWFDGALVVQNDGPFDICMDPWYLYFSQSSQDSAAGHPGRIDTDGYRLTPGERWGHAYTSRTAPAWWCVEQTQQTRYADDFWFIGSEVPPPLMPLILYDTDENDNGEEDHREFPDWNNPAPQTQYNIWGTIASEPVFAVGREPNYLEMVPGETASLTLHVINLGREAGSMRVSETIPAGTEAGEFSIEPTITTENTDGSTTFVWAFKVDGALDDADLNAPTDYAGVSIDYQLNMVGPECGARTVGAVPDVTWADTSGVAHTSVGTALVVACCE